MSQVFIPDDWKVRHGPQLVPTILLVSVVVFSLRLASPGLPMILCQAVGTLGVGVALYLMWGMARSRHSTIEISDRAVCDGSLLRFGRRVSVPIADIAGVSLGQDRLELRTTAAGTVGFWVGGLSMATREAARVAIEHAVRVRKIASSGAHLEP